MMRRSIVGMLCILWSIPLLSQRWIGPRDAQITGTVLGEDDMPIHARISLYQFLVHDGRMAVMLGCAATTGAMGTFRCQHLRPGAYLLVATQLRETSRRSGEPSIASANALPLFVLYPAIPDIGYSDLIRLVDNDAESVTVRADPVPLSDLSISSNAAHTASLVVSIEVADTSIPVYTTSHRDPGGDFLLRRLPSGTYSLTERWSVDDREREAVGTVMADGFQSSTVTLIDAGPYEIAGAVQYAADLVPRPSDLFLSSADPHRAARYAATVDKDGAFQFKGIPAGIYYISFALGSGFYIHGVSMGGQSLDTNEITVSDATSELPLTITAAKASGVITGSLGLHGGEPAAGVVLEAPSFHAFLLVPVSSSGRFRIGGLPPVEYRLFGWADSRAIPYRDENFERRNADKAAEVDLDDGNTSGDIDLECLQPAL